MQTKDIPDEPILAFLETIARDGVDVWNSGARDSKIRATWATWYLETDGTPFPNSVANAMPPRISRKLVLSKMRSMIKRGLVDGCACGCRGDFKLTVQTHSNGFPSAS